MVAAWVGARAAFYMETTDNSSESATRTAAQFASTHWSIVLAARDSTSPASFEALEKLCRAY